MIRRDALILDVRNSPMAVNPRRLRAARNDVMRDLESGTPWDYLWRDAELLHAGVMLKTGTRFGAVPFHDRETLRDWLGTL